MLATHSIELLLITLYQGERFKDCGPLSQPSPSELLPRIKLIRFDPCSQTFHRMRKVGIMEIIYSVPFPGAARCIHKVFVPHCQPSMRYTNYALEKYVPGLRPPAQITGASLPAASSRNSGIRHCGKSIEHIENVCNALQRA